MKLRVLAAALLCAGLNHAPALAQTTILPLGQQCFQATSGLNGMVGTLGAVTGGSGGTSGAYGGVALTGGSGTGATANITVSGGGVTAVTILNPGVAFVVGDVLSAAAGTIGGVTGFSVPVNSVTINSSLAGGTVGYYLPKTLTFKTTWKNSTQTTPNTNPVQLDQNGCAVVYGIGSYRQIVKDSLGNTVWDALTASTAALSTTPAASGAGDFMAIGTIIPIAGYVAPVNYVLAFGQAISRASFPDALNALTISSAASCVSGNTTLSGLVSTAQMSPGETIEGSCIAPGTFIASIAGPTSIVLNNAATATASPTVRVFPWGNGNGSSTFNLPDLRGRVLPGADAMGGSAASRLTTTFYGSNPSAPVVAGGTQFNVISQANLPIYTLPNTLGISNTLGLNDPGHTHTLNNGTGVTHGGVFGTGAGTTGGTNSDITVNSGPTNVTLTGGVSLTGGVTSGGSGTAFSIVQPSITINYAIKIQNGTLPTVGVLSFGGMTGDILCGTGLTCINNTVTTGTAVQTGALKVAVLGDSRAAPTGLTAGAVSFADYFVAHMPQWGNATVTNYAIPGQTLAQVAAGYAAGAGSNKPAPGQSGVLTLVYAGEINSCVTGGITDANALFVILQGLVTTAQHDGWTVVIGTEPPATSVTGACETTRLAFNQLILGYYTNALYLVRPDVAFPNDLNTNIYVDGIHFNANGANLTSGLIADSISYYPMFSQTGSATRTLGKFGVNTIAEPVFSFEVWGTSTTGFPVLSITDGDTSGHQFLLYARCNNIAQDFCLYDQTTNNSTSFKWISKANGDFQIPNGSLFVGTALTTGVATATPNLLDLGDTFSSTAGANPKLKVYHSTGGTIGLGVSNGQLDFIGTSVAYSFYNGATRIGAFDSTGFDYANVAAPSSPASGHVKTWTDSTDLRFHDKNSAGAIGTTVVADTGASHNFLTAISAAGVISKAQPACSDLSTAQSGCSTATGTSGATIPLLNGTNTWSGSQTFGAGVLTASTPVINGLPTGTGVASAATASTLVSRDASGNINAALATVTGLSAISSAGTATIIKVQATATGGRDYWFESTDNGNGNGGGKFIVFDNTASAVRAFWDSSGNFTNNASVQAGTYLKSGAVTVASLPSAAGAGPGTRYMVTDSNSTTFLATVAGGGANIVPVVSDGTNWKIGGWLFERDFDPANDNIPAFMAKVG